MNLVVLSGRLSKNPELKYLPPNGIAVSSFDIAIEKEYIKNDNNKADFFTIQCWNKLAESIANNLDKGRKVLVHGYLKTNTWSDENNKNHKNILVVAKRIELLDYPKEINTKYNFEEINETFFNDESAF